MLPLPLSLATRGWGDKVAMRCNPGLLIGARHV